MTRRRVLLVSGVLAALAAALVAIRTHDPTASGREAFDAGDFARAQAAFDDALAQGPEAAPLLYNRALVALARDDLPGARAFAARAADRAPADFEGRAAMVQGIASFRHALVAEQAARQPGADARALQEAIGAAEDAVTAWRVAVRSRADWRAASRNLERGSALLARLQERRRVQQGKPPKPDTPDPDADPSNNEGEDGGDPPANPGADTDPPPRPDAAIEVRDLPGSRILGLLELLRRKEAEKQTLRRAVRRARAADVERDW